MINIKELMEEKITGFFNRIRFLFRFGIIKLKERIGDDALMVRLELV